LTLPAPESCTGKVYVIRKTDDTNYTLTFSYSIYYTATNYFTTLNFPKTIRIQSNGSKWYEID
jgi:hypothetical protein